MSGSTDKPRVRVPAGSSYFVGDSFVNFAASLGYGAQNLQSGGTYQLSALSRNPWKLEMMYRGSWMVRQIVCAIAEDMTRAGIALETDMAPDDGAAMMQLWQQLHTWQRLQSTIEWARLYGGAIAVMMLDGQNPATPMRVDSIRPGGFKGLLVFDRWQLNPHLEDTVQELGPHFGMPRYYDVVSDAHSVPAMRIHHTRCIRFEGLNLPYRQRMAENLWGLSVLEPMLDRMMAFDSTTAGAAQLVYKAHLRTLSIEGLRNIIASGGKMYDAVKQQIALIRLMQSIEGMTILDKNDEFATHQYSFGGLSDVMIQFGQQLSGASQIPLVRLFGQSPAGLSATGESDLRNYYDMINAQQEAKLRMPLTILLDIVHRSKFGRPLPEGFTFSFRPLWQLRENEKVTTAQGLTTTVLSALEQSLIGPKTALKELREGSRATGVWTNITDEQIAKAEEDPPVPEAMGLAGMPGDPMADLPGPESPQTLPSQGATAPQPGPPGPPADADPPGRVRLSRPVRAAHPLDRLIASRQRRKPTRAAQIIRLFRHDQRASVDIHGLTCVIEADKGETRGPWRHSMPCAYGYISGTSSAEGPHEQMDCYIGDDHTADKVFIVHQHKLDGGFDEHKCMLGFPDEQTARNTYHQAFNDGSGPQRLHKLVTMTVPQFKRWLRAWKYGKAA